MPVGGDCEKPHFLLTWKDLALNGEVFGEISKMLYETEQIKMTSLNLMPVAEKISQHLARVEKARDTSYILHREIIKKSGLAIRAVHRGDQQLTDSIIAEARESLVQATQTIEHFDELAITGFVHDAQKEYVEACATAAIVFNRELPDPDSLGVSYSAYLKGLSEVIGELRREILDLMRQDRGDLGEEYLQAMEEIYSMLVTMDFSDAVTAGLRRSTDQARGILERTRGDFTNHIVSRRIRNDLKKYAQVPTA